MEKMEKFTKEEKELLEQNPNIQAVLSNQVLYTKDFKEKAVIEYESGKDMIMPLKLFLNGGLQIVKK